MTNHRRRCSTPVSDPCPPQRESKPRKRTHQCAICKQEGHWKENGEEMAGPSSFKREGEKLAGYTVISQIQVVEAKAYPRGFGPKGGVDIPYPRLRAQDREDVMSLVCWSRADLRCCVNFCCTTKWLSYRCIYILFHILFHYGLSQDIEYSSLCCTIGPCCLSILYVIVCICYVWESVSVS